MNLYRLCRLHNSDFYSDSACFNPLDEVCFIVIYLTLSLSLTHKSDEMSKNCPKTKQGIDHVILQPYGHFTFHYTLLHTTCSLFVKAKETKNENKSKFTAIHTF